MGTNYYVQTPACEKACDHCAASDRIHLGKTSSGWRFSFQAQPDWTPDDAFYEWTKLAVSGPISDEYGATVTFAELIALIDAKRDQRSHLEPQPDLGMSRVYCGWFTSGGHEFCNRDFT